MQVYQIPHGKHRTRSILRHNPNHFHHHRQLPSNNSNLLRYCSRLLCYNQLQICHQRQHYNHLYRHQHLCLLNNMFLHKHLQLFRHLQQIQRYLHVHQVQDRVYVRRRKRELNCELFFFFNISLLLFFFTASSGLPPRTKYVVDPSVQSNQYGIRNNFSAPSPLLPAPIQQAPINPSLFQTNAVTNVPLNNNINNNNNVQQSLLNPLVPHPLLNNNPLQPNNMPFNQQANAPGMMQGNQATAEMAQSAMNVLPANAAHGWNDPPAFQKTNRLTQVS